MSVDSTEEEAEAQRGKNHLPKVTQLVSSKTETTTHISRLWSPCSCHSSVTLLPAEPPPLTPVDDTDNSPQTSLPLKLPQCEFRVSHHMETLLKRKLMVLTISELG